ncbi:hypothetical protein Tco_1371223 [Tanacetum coccineum]
MSYTNLTISSTLESDKIYHNLKKFHQWLVMEEGITTYVNKYLVCLKMRNDYLKPSGLLLDEIQIDDMFHSIEEPVVIMDHEVKRLKVSRIPIVKSSSNSNNQADPKFQKDYKAEYKKMKAKLALLEASPSSSQNPKTFQPKNKGLVAETFDWDEEEVSDKEEVTQVKVLMALADDELTVGKSHARNGEWVDITIRKVNTLLSMDEDADWQNYLKYINIDLKFVEEQQLNLLFKYNKMVFELNKCRDELLILKQAKLDAVTFQIQNTEFTKLNHALQEQLKEEKKINEKWLTSLKRLVNVLVSKFLTKIRNFLVVNYSLRSSKMNENENLFVPASMRYDQEMVPKTKDWVKRLKPDSKLLNFNTRRILFPESQVVNESPEPTKTLNTP